MLVDVFVFIAADLRKAVHVELPDKGRDVLVPEIFLQHVFSKRYEVYYLESVRFLHPADMLNARRVLDQHAFTYSI